MGNHFGNTKYRDEFIRRWVETEVLVQRAQELNLLNGKNYYNILEESGKELAASVAIQNYLDTQPEFDNESDLKKFYFNNKEDFKISEDSYVLNSVTFVDESSAIKFRNTALKEGWKESLSKFAESKSLLESQLEKTYKLSEIQSKRIVRVLKKLFNKEISLVFKTELNKFVVVQEIDKISKNSIPKFKYVKDNVLKTYLVLKQRELASHYIDSLLAQKNVKIY